MSTFCLQIIPIESSMEGNREWYPLLLHSALFFYTVFMAGELSFIHIQIPQTGYIGLIQCSTIEGTASWNTVEGTLRVATVPDVPSMQLLQHRTYPQSTLNGTPTAGAFSGTASYETNIHVAGQEESGCVHWVYLSIHVHLMTSQWPHEVLGEILFFW